MSQQGTNHFEQGSGTLNIRGTLNIATGGMIVANGTQAAAISNLATNLANDADGTAIATAVNNNATAVNSILAALRGAGIIAT